MAICQTSTMTEYMNRFEPLMHLVLSHNPAYDLVFFTTRFHDGLKDDIRAPIILHRPHNLENAYQLACLQEGVQDTRFKESRRLTSAYTPVRPATVVSGKPTGDTVVGPTTMIRDNNRPPGQSDWRPTDDRVSALRAYHHAKRLCFKCGEKWSHNHQCATTVSLHVVGELLAILNSEEEPTETVEPSESDEDCMMSISKVALSGVDSRTLSLWGLVEDKELLILVDSGSSHSFINTQTATCLHQPRVQITPTWVRIANGQVLSCSEKLAQCPWWV